MAGKSQMAFVVFFCVNSFFALYLFLIHIVAVTVSFPISLQFSVNCSYLNL